MADLAAAQLAMRSHLQGISVATTGVIDLEATLTGYARAAGSFKTDGFAAGMEVTPVNFPQLTVGVIEELTDLTMTIYGGRTVAATAPNRSLTAKLPERVAWDNVPLEPLSQKPYVEEDFVPATSELRSGPHEGGWLLDEGLYVVRWYAEEGLDVLALARSAKAVIQRFKAGTALAVSDGTVVQVKTKPAPYRGKIYQAKPGWSVVVITIPWRLYSLNS